MELYPASAHDLHKSGDTNIPVDVNITIEQVYEACRGPGTNESMLSETLGSKSQDERYMIAVFYEKAFKRELKAEIRSETSGYYRYLLRLISTPLPQSEAKILHHFTKTFHKREKCIYPVLMGRTNEELAILRREYYDKYNSDLSARMDKKLSGDYHKVIMAALQGAKEDFDESYHTSEQAENDAAALYDAGEGRMGTDEATFIRICLRSPSKYIETLNAAYVDKTGNSLVDAVENEFSGNAQAALSFHIRLVLEPHKLLAEHFHDTMSGITTDERALSEAIVRYQPMLSSIAAAYEELYEESLRDRIEGTTRRDYQHLLLVLYDHAV